MEKLLFKGIGWGAEKIPDSWFEAMPGGYYKAKKQAEADRASDKGHSGDHRRSHRSSSHRRRRSQDDRRRHRRHENDGADENDDEMGYLSDGHRSRHHRESRHSRVDGEDDFDPINNRLRRPRSRMMMRDEEDEEDDRRGHGHRHDYERDDYGRDDYGRDSRYDSPRRNGKAPYPEQAAYPYRDPADRPPMGPGPPLAAGLAGAGLGTAAAAYANGSQSHSPASYSPATSYPQTASHSSATSYPQTASYSPATSSQTPSIIQGGVKNGYVPYANIYGSPLRNPPQQAPPSSIAGSVQPTATNQVGAPVARQPYHQNPFAQNAVPGSQPSYIPDPYSNSRPYDEYEHDRYDAYGRAPDRYPPNYDGHRSNRPDSRDSYDSYSDSDRRRSRSRHRRDDQGNEKSQGRSKSKIREKFDTSKSGLGYGAVGALAGGLVGSGVGKGKIPTAVGATVGAMGANAFGAREKRKADSRHEAWQNDGTYARGEAVRNEKASSERSSRDPSR